MVIFHCYLKLPEGKPPFSYGFPMGFPMVIPQTWVTFCGSNPHIFGAELERTQITQGETGRMAPGPGVTS